MGETPRSESSTAGGQTRRLCVVLHTQGQRSDAGLVRVLKKRNMQVVECGNPHEAFARVCNDAREGRKAILVLDGEEPRSMGDRLIAAMERFTPAAVCWNHLPGANPPIVPIVGPLESAIGAASSGESIEKDEVKTPEPKIETMASPAPKLKLTEPESAPVHRSPVSAKDVLDADELDALLAQEMPKRDDRK